jgi:hypothetical protein
MRLNCKLIRLFVLLFSLAGIAFAQAQTTTEPDQGVKRDMKDAGRSTKSATKKTARKTKRGTKKATHKTARKTRQGAQKVEDKTQPQ